VANQTFSGAIEPAIRGADLIYIALPIGVTLDILPEIAQNAAPHALVTDACSTKLRICTAAVELFEEEESSPIFLGGHPMAGRELSGFAQSDADLFQKATYALVGPSQEDRDPRINRLTKILEKLGARPSWLGAQQHDYAVGLASHLPQLTAVALGSFLYDRLDENGLPITLAGPGLRDTLRLAGSSYATWRDIVLTNREVLSAALDTLRPPPRRSTRAPRFPRTRSRLRRRQRTIQTPPLPVVQALACEPNSPHYNRLKPCATTCSDRLTSLTALPSNTLR